MRVFARPIDARTRSVTFYCACRVYLSKLNFYRQRQWSCQVTGKHGLTYEEAATSEQKSKAATGQVSIVRPFRTQPLVKAGLDRRKLNS